MWFGFLKPLLVLGLGTALVVTGHDAAGVAIIAFVAGQRTSGSNAKPRTRSPAALRELLDTIAAEDGQHPDGEEDQGLAEGHRSLGQSPRW